MKAQKLFTNLDNISVPQGLNQAILARVHIYEIRQARIRSVWLGTITVASLIAVVPAYSYVASQLTQSGFFEYFSFIFSDGATVAASWHDFGLLLAESLPPVALTVFLTAVVAVVASTRLTIRNIRVALV